MISQGRKCRQIRMQRSPKLLTYTSNTINAKKIEIDSSQALLSVLRLAASMASPKSLWKALMGRGKKTRGMLLIGHRNGKIIRSEQLEKDCSTLFLQ